MEAGGAASLAICYLLFAISYLLSAYAVPGDAAPVVKIGVIAPFEGAGGRWATPFCPDQGRRG